MHSAVAHGGAELVRALVAAGAEINLPDHRGFTPLFAALDAGADPQTVELLRDVGLRI